MINEDFRGNPVRLHLRRYAGQARATAEGVLVGGRAHIHEVGYQLRLSFFLIVALPTLMAAAYYLLIAAPRYVAEAKFSVYTQAPARADPLAMLAQLPMASASLEDQHIVQDYINSRAMLEAVEKKYDLQRIYGTGGDIFSELWSGLSVERRTAYWTRHVHVTIDSNSGIADLQVDTFRPEDSLALVNGILAETRTMVENLSSDGDADAVKLAAQQFDKAAAQLAAVRAKVTQFRQDNHMVDAAHTGQFTAEMVGGLEVSLADAQSQIQQARSYLAPSDPRIAMLQARADSLRSQIDLQKNGLSQGSPTAPGDVALRGPDVLPASTLSQSETLDTELDVALKSYAAAAAANFEAQGNLSRDRRYLEVFIKPALPEDAGEPQRLRMIATVLVASFILWCLIITIGGAVRDHAGI